MPSLGSISVNFTASTSEFVKKLQTINTAVKETTKIFADLNVALTSTPHLGKLIAGTQNLAKSNSALGSSTKSATVGIDKETMSLAQVKASIRSLPKENKIAAQSNYQISRSFRQVGTNAYKMSQSLSAANSQSLSSMLSLGNMVRKIAHYISFSIGVQMVMVLRQGFSTMIENLYDFNKAVANTVTVSGYLGAAFDEASEKVSALSISLAEDTVFSAQQVATALYSMASAGYEVVNMLESDFIPILEYAAATQTSLEDATKAVMVVMKQFGMELEDTGMIVDTFTALITNSFMTQEKMSEAMKYAGITAGIVGADFQETAAAVTLLTDRGLEGGQAGQRLNMVFTKLLKPTDAAKEMLMEMGLTLNDINPRFYSLTEIFTKLKAAGFGAADAANMFRARTAASAMALIDNIDAIDQYMHKMRMSGGLTSDIASKQQQAYAGLIDTTKTTFSDLSIIFGESLKPGIESLLNAVNAIIPVLEAIGTHFNVIVKVLSSGIMTWAAYKIAIKLSTLELSKHGMVTSLNIVQTGTLATITDVASFSFLKLASSIKTAAIAKQAFIGKMIALFAVMHLAGEIIMGTADFLDYLGTALVLAGGLFMAFGQTVITTLYGIQIAAGPIGWVIAAIGLLVTAISMFTGESEETKKKVEDLNKAIKDHEEVLKSDLWATEKYTDTHNKLTKNLEEELKLIDDLNVARKEGDVDKLAKAQKKWVDNQSNQKELINALISSTSEYLNTIQATGDLVGTATAEYKKYADAAYDLGTAEENMIDLQYDRERAINKLSNMMNIYGDGSVEVATANNELMRIDENILKLGNEMIDMTSAKEKAYKLYVNTIKDADTVESELIDRALEIYDVELKLFSLMEDKSKMQAYVSMWTSIEGKEVNNLEEATKRLTEETHDLYEIKYKMYKLNQDASKRADNLFDALSEEGLLNKDVIDQYSEMKKAEGRRMKEKVDFSRELQKFGKADQDLITDWIQAYSETGNIEEANKKVGYSLSSVTGMTASAAKEFEEYGWAMYDYNNKLATFSSNTQTYTDDLIDNGIAGSAVADAHWDIEDAAHNVAAMTETLNDKFADLAAQGMQDVIDQAAKLWVGFGDFPELDLPEWSLGDALSFDEDESIPEHMKNIQDAFQQGIPSFQQALKKINDETGYFADKGADITTVMAGYQAMMAKQGIFGTDVYSSEMATAALAYQSLIDRGYEHQEIMDMIGGDFTQLATLGNSALVQIEADAKGASDQVEILSDNIYDLISQLNTLQDEEWIASLYVEIQNMNEITKFFEMIMMYTLPFMGPFALMAKGGLVGKGIPNVSSFAKGISKTSGPTLSLIGEDGPEAVVPLVNNKSNGEAILRTIIPRYFPDLMSGMQINSSAGGSIPGNVGNSTIVEEYNFYGDFILSGIENEKQLIDKFMEELKYRRRIR